MPNIKPVSDLRNYGEVLRDVAVGQPVFLTKNGHGRYAVIDMEEYREYERMKAMDWLLSELDKGRVSGESDGWLPAEQYSLSPCCRGGGQRRSGGPAPEREGRQLCLRDRPGAGDDRSVHEQL